MGNICHEKLNPVCQILSFCLCVWVPYIICFSLLAADVCPNDFIWN